MATGGSLSGVGDEGAMAQERRMGTGRQEDPESSFVPWEETERGVGTLGLCSCVKFPLDVSPILSWVSVTDSPKLPTHLANTFCKKVILYLQMSLKNIVFLILFLHS